MLSDPLKTLLFNLFEASFVLCLSFDSFNLCSTDCFSSRFVNWFSMMLILLHISTCFSRRAQSWSFVLHQMLFQCSSSFICISNPPSAGILQPRMEWGFVYFPFRIVIDCEERLSSWLPTVSLHLLCSFWVTIGCLLHYPFSTSIILVFVLRRLPHQFPL